jgi:magnesium-protoporphyrin IX monomethyl ester (oxidative) cyclase
MQVFRITTEICRQVFPVTLDIDNPAFLAGLEKLRQTGERIAAAKAQRGLGGTLKRVALIGSAGLTLGRMFLMRPRRHALPQDIRLAPAW